MLEGTRLSDQSAGNRPKRSDHWGAAMARAQNGDAEAYAKLLHEILPFTRAYVSSRLRDAATVDDVVQNVLMSIHRARHTYRPERPFVAWLRAIARNAVIDSVRERARRSQRETPLADYDPPSGMPLPDEFDQGLSPELERALAALPPNQREAVELLHVEQLSVAEAAERVGVKPGALKVRAHRGYQALRSRLKREAD